MRHLISNLRSSCCRRCPHLSPWHSEAMKKKVVVILGATGSGKTRLSIDLATHFNGEIINSDKMQLYQGLDITTNKVTTTQRRNIPHHLLGVIDSSKTELTPSDYRSLASSVISSISTRDKLPIIVGGSNSFVYALLAENYNPGSDSFNGPPTRMSPELRYDCCFLWVNVAPGVLNSYLDRRVDDMMKSGMLNELAEFYESEGDGSRTRPGLGKAIGVPEFAAYFNFRQLLNREKDRGMIEVERKMYEGAVRAIKDNTCLLAEEQVRKIQRLKENATWNLHEVETTEVFRAMMTPDSGRPPADFIYEKNVVIPSVNTVKRFLQD